MNNEAESVTVYEAASKTGSGELGCTDCMGTGLDPMAFAGGIEQALNDAYAEGRNDEREALLIEQCGGCFGEGVLGDGLPCDECAPLARQEASRSRTDHPAPADAEVSGAITIRYERSGCCFWHIGCKAQHHAPPMRIGQDDTVLRRTLIECTACGQAGYYPHGRVGTVCCDRAAIDRATTGDAA